MTLVRVAVRNFQSLRSVDLELGRLTVIVGSSNSGKSAFIRAIRALASNVRGTSYVTRGQTKMAVQALTDKGIVTLERGEGHGVYRVSSAPDVDLTFTKLAGAVPAEVSQYLGIQPAVDGVSINFAGQFDKPYLLDESGGQVARTLGALTNVDVIFGAVREANRRRLAVNAELKTREADLARVEAAISKIFNPSPPFSGLPERLAACAEAEAATERASALQSRSDSLKAAAKQLETALQLEAKASSYVETEIPDLSAAEKIYDRLFSLRTLARTWQVEKARADEQGALVAKHHNAVDAAEEELHTKVTEGGRCPLCNRTF